METTTDRNREREREREPERNKDPELERSPHPAEGTGTTLPPAAPKAAALRQGWYLRCQQGDLAERVVLVGDPGRVEQFAGMLEQPVMVNTNRALLAVTGRYEGVPVSVVAFGMGAPIMAVVLEEIAWLGARLVLRAGTAMSVKEGWYGRFIVTTAALRGESTSLTYLPAEYPAAADYRLNAVVAQQLQDLGAAYGYGMMASYDGFYSQLFALDPARQAQVLERRAFLQSLGIDATDMETSALLAIGRYLGLQCGSLCLVTVDGPSQAALQGREREEGEQNLLRAALAGLAHCALEDPVNGPNTRQANELVTD